MKEKILKKGNKGITLIALVVTIIVLIILAGISINILFGDNGIIKKAQMAGEKSISSSDAEKIKLAYVEYMADNPYSNTIEGFLEYLKTKDEYIVDDETNEIELNSNLYSVEKVGKEIVVHEEGKAIMPRVKSAQVIVENGSVQVSVETKNANGATLKYVLKEEDGVTVVDESNDITATNYTFNNIDEQKSYILTIIITNENGTKTKNVPVAVLSLEERTKGKANFVISPSEGWQEQVTASINSSFTGANVILQYKKGTSGTWTPYSEAFSVDESVTLYGRFYNTVTEEVGYEFQYNVQNVDNVNPNAPTLALSGTKVGDHYTSDVIVTITDNGDTLGEVDHIEYSVTGAQTVANTTGNSVTITEVGISTVKAKVYDKIGNASEEASLSIVKGYEITYNSNTGSGIMAPTIGIVAANEFTAPTGKQFKEWNTNSDGTGTAYKKDDIVPEDIELFAIWIDPPQWSIVTDSGEAGLSVGDLVKPNVDSTSVIKNERFYVIGIDGTGANKTVRLITEKCVNTSDNSYLQSTSANPVLFDSGGKNLYANSSIKNLVNTYVGKLTGVGLILENVETAEGGSPVTGVKGRLMWGTDSSGEIKTLLNAGFKNLVYGPSSALLNYWLGSPASNNLCAWKAYGNYNASGGNIGTSYVNNWSDSPGCLRPVIKVLASRIG